MEKEHTVFTYLYRDAGNYKIWRSLLLRGEFHGGEAEIIRTQLEGREFFIPEQVGLEPLQDAFRVYSDVPSDDDHVWHEFHSVRSATCKDMADLPVWGLKSDLFNAFQRVARWDESASNLHFELAEMWASALDVEVEGPLYPQ